MFNRTIRASGVRVIRSGARRHTDKRVRELPEGDYRAVGYFEKGASPCDVFSRAQRTAPLKQVNFRVCT